MINTPKHLAYTIKVKLKEIYLIIDNIDKFYSEKKFIKKSNQGAPVLDRNGCQKYRVLNPSHGRLKIIQKRIHQNILSQLPMPDYIYGAVKGRDNIKNVNAHKGKKYHFTTDIRNFFPSISHSQVFQMFRDFNFSPTVSRLLTQLTTYKGRLPQGAPSSPSLANLVFIITGDLLDAFSKKNKLTFTSFVDDLAFSSPHDFKNLVPEIIDIISLNFRISHNKTYYSRNPNITGLHPMNNHLRISDPVMEKYRIRETKSPDQKSGIVRYKERIDKINYGLKAN